MKFKSLTTALVIACGASAFAAGDHTPKHGGILVESKSLEFEIVAKPEVIQVYLGDHGKPVKLDGATGKVTLLNGGEKADFNLAPAGDKLEARGPFKALKGTKGIASVTLPGKPAVTARFEVK